MSTGRPGVTRHHTLCTLGCAALTSLGCHSEARRLREEPAAYALPAGFASPQPTTGPVLGTPLRVQVRTPWLADLYLHNAWAVAEGQRLYAWYNCSGCHARGGGGMGPALLDAHWVYGNSPEQLFASIAGGRPNGMPGFGQRVPEAQIWQLVAYVQSLGGGVPKAVVAARSDEISPRLDSIQQIDRPERGSGVSP
jgi:cytochrome c oxidase cbb3-type subunit 3